MNIVINRKSGGRVPKAADGEVKTKLSSGRPYNFVDHFQKYRHFFSFGESQHCREGQGNCQMARLNTLTISLTQASSAY